MDKNSTPILERAMSESSLTSTSGDNRPGPSRLTLMQIRQFARVYSVIPGPAAFSGIVLN